MTTTQYIGSRYVPLFADPMEWSSAKQYEPLTIVTHEGNSYTAKQFVPVGVDISNGEFWALTGNYNGQVEQYRRETAAAKAAADSVQNDIDTILPKSAFTETTVKDYVDTELGDVVDEIGTVIDRRFDGYFFVSDYDGSDDDAFDAALSAADAFDGMPTIVIDKPLHIRRSHIIEAQPDIVTGKRIISSRPLMYNVASRMLAMSDDCWDFIVDVDNVSVLCINTDPVTGYAVEANSDAHFVIENIKIKNNSGVRDSNRYAFSNTNIFGIRYNTCSIDVDGLLTIGLNGSVIAERNKDAQTNSYMDFCTFNNVHMSYPQGCAFTSYKNDSGSYTNITVGYPSRDYHGYLLQFNSDSGSYCSNLFLQMGSQPADENTDSIISVYNASMVFDIMSMEHFSSSRLFYLSQSFVQLNSIKIKFEMQTIAYCYGSSTFIVGNIIGSSISEVAGSLFACRNNTSLIKMLTQPSIDYSGEDSYPPFPSVGGGSIYDIYTDLCYDLRLSSGTVALRIPGVSSTVSPFNAVGFDSDTNKITLSGLVPKAIENATIVQADCEIKQGTNVSVLDTRIVDNAIQITFPSAPSGTVYMWLKFKCYKAV